ncbi:DUF3426 domain-containing protein [Herminiimonas sp. NPDC097707]|uniref:DUF3426 domain-containing protein n=1 Tax=Herminiimonas sp. NPDC097707 TaxID=3364007 RepID=UPI00383ACE36
MALATQCPHCQTTFRVVHDQLKLRAGLVRCGHCKEIFNGIEHLLPPTDAEPAVVEPAAAFAAAPAAFIAPAAVAMETPLPAASDDMAEAETDVVEANTTPDAHLASDKIDFDIPTAFETESESEPESGIAIESDIEATVPAAIHRADDPLQRMTLLDFTRDFPSHGANVEQDASDTQEFSRAEKSAQSFDPNAPDELDEAIEDLQRKPWRNSKKSVKGKTRSTPPPDEADIEDEEEPAFLKHARRKQKMGGKLRALLGIGCLILFLAALAQGTYLFRNQIAGQFPQTKPLLTQLCDVFSCRIDLPAQIAAVSIESSELQTLAESKDTFVLTTLLRNYSDSLQTWPHIELTLNDANEKPLLRRVFAPADYLSAAEVRAGFAASSEHTVKLSFELTQIKASGYRVYLFYP